VSKFDFVDQEMRRRETAHLTRRLRRVTPLADMLVEVDGQAMVNFCSNDYLGISKHPLLAEGASRFGARYGTGSTASRLICGSLACFDEVEARLATLKQVESALIFNSGFQANVSIIPALADNDSIIFSDELNHNSIIQGVTLARCAKQLFAHNDLDHLESLLESSKSGAWSRRVIITESVFSMDGDRADIDRLVSLARDFDAILVVDEAHATGVLGEAGMGLTVGRAVDITMGTFGKALGCFGAYIASSNQLRDYLINCCGGFIYSTALPPTTLGAVDAALTLVPQMDVDRKRLLDHAQLLRHSLGQLGYATGNSSTQIIPVLLGDEDETLRMGAKLERAGFLATPIRPPTVPAGTSRIRIALSSAHTREQIESLIEVFK
jgi:8-amino-7-oxononanoate synthase